MGSQPRQKSRQLMSRRNFLLGAGGALLAGGANAGWMRGAEPWWFEVTEKHVPLMGVRKPLRILHLSDFHASPAVSFELISKAIDQALELSFDLVLLTGDFITWDMPDRERYAGLLSRLSQRAPTFACLGNHDGGSWAGSSHGYAKPTEVVKLLAESGITLLINESAEFAWHDNTIRLIGLGDWWGDSFSPEEAFGQRLDASFTLVLCHNPDAKRRLFDYDWQVMFCGHTHGGQLVIPVLAWRPFLPVRDKSFPEGLRAFGPSGDKWIHITRGVGNLHGLRWNCRPEISVVLLG
ncbi:MAG: phosphodiesterase YaeI [Verrucomicrobiales bacterium]